MILKRPVFIGYTLEQTGLIKQVLRVKALTIHKSSWLLFAFLYTELKSLRKRMKTS